MITHVLDTSALLAHYLEEPGMDEVGRLLSGHPGEIGLSFVSWLELAARLLEVAGNPAEAERAFRLYTDVLTTPLARGRGGGAGGPAAARGGHVPPAAGGQPDRGLRCDGQRHAGPPRPTLRHDLAGTA